MHLRVPSQELIAQPDGDVGAKRSRLCKAAPIVVVYGADGRGSGGRLNHCGEVQHGGRWKFPGGPNGDGCG